MESPRTPRDNDLGGVTSRSGRIIKKSSKLMDFTSPDDIEIMKAKKQASATRKLNMTQLTHIKMEPELHMSHVLPSKSHHFDDGFEDDAYAIKSHDGNYLPEHDDEADDDDDYRSDSDEQQMVIKTEDDPEIEFVTPRRSIYMSEKSSKKKMMKDGKIVMGKAQRKDKGKTRYTAYMLWAKDARQQISRANPDLDFASVSKKLGEMWANVPTNVKYNWKRRAKRLANKIKKNNGVKGIPQPSKYMQQKYYLNKTSTNPNTAAAVSTASSPMTKQQKQFQKLLKSEKSKTQSIQNAQKQHKEKYLNAMTPTTSGSYKTSLVPSTSSSRSNNVQVNRPLDLAPIDVAAHLKLLGESLINIGERLSQHEGQIAVSGSLSVLLDSILCAMGSLMCCLNYVPELNFQEDPPLTNGDSFDGADGEEPKNLFQSIMDHCHYIMPGL